MKRSSSCISFFIDKELEAGKNGSGLAQRIRERLKHKMDFILANVLENEPIFDEVMEQLKELPFVGDVRGCGYFRVLELVKDKNTKQSFTDEECNWLLRDELSPRIFEAGLICRVDDRADPVLVLSPTLICGPQELRFIAEVLTDALQHAAEEFQKR